MYFDDGMKFKLSRNKLVIIRETLNILKDLCPSNLLLQKDWKDVNVHCFRMPPMVDQLEVEVVALG